MVYTYSLYRMSGEDLEGRPTVLPFTEEAPYVFLKTSDVAIFHL